MPIIFQNPGLIDLRAVQVMGLHAKDTDNPIGQFGTGLKYAIAVLLRSGCTISIWRGTDESKFHTREETFRGKQFQFVYMDSTPLGFTLDLGKNWQMWQAIRELESNCRDEGGTSANLLNWLPQSHSTTIVVNGAAAIEAYSQLSDIFIQSTPIWENAELAIHPASGEQGKWVYYRGVRCHALNSSTLYRYNIKSHMDLTEDRTIAYQWLLPGKIGEAIGACDNADLIEAIVNPPGKNCLEDTFEYSQYGLSDEFIEVVRGLGARATANAWRAVRAHCKIPEFDATDLSPYQQKMLETAQGFLFRMGEKKIHEYSVRVSPDLGKNVLGRAMLREREIWIAERTFEMGQKQLTSTLYEEYIHMHRRLNDLNYEMQHFLFDKIISLAAELQGEIL